MDIYKGLRKREAWILHPTTTPGCVILGVHLSLCSLDVPPVRDIRDGMAWVGGCLDPDLVLRPLHVE